MRYTTEQIVEILKAAKTLGATNVKAQGFEVSFYVGGEPSQGPPSSRRPQNFVQEPVFDVQAWRLRGVGGSDAPVVMDASKKAWGQTRQKLWEIKTKRRKPDPPTYPMRRGIKLEPEARARYEDMVGMEMPHTLVTHPKHDFIRLSADGANQSEGRAVEIKCPGREDHAIARAGEIPPHYLFQLVHYLFVLGFDRVDYFSYYKWAGHAEDIAIVPFTRKKALESKLVSEEMKFWDRVVKDIPPASPPKLKLAGKPEVFRVRRNAWDR